MVRSVSLTEHVRIGRVRLGRSVRDTERHRASSVQTAADHLAAAAESHARGKVVRRGEGPAAPTLLEELPSSSQEVFEKTF